MQVDHLAIWTADLEKMKGFYEKYFAMTAGARYHNPANEFTSYFLAFPAGSVRLELMHRPDVVEVLHRGRHAGLAHVAIAVGSEERVRQLTEQLRTDGMVVQSEPRITGDGYFESVILDPDGNWIEITV